MRRGLRQQGDVVFLHPCGDAGRYDQYVIWQNGLPILRAFHRQRRVARQDFRKGTFPGRIKMHLHDIANTAAGYSSTEQGAKRFNSPC